MSGIGTEVLIPNLSPSSKYIFSVAAVNEVGTGPSAEVEAETIAESEYILCCTRHSFILTSAV